MKCCPPKKQLLALVALLGATMFWVSQPSVALGQIEEIERQLARVAQEELSLRHQMEEIEGRLARERRQLEDRARMVKVQIAQLKVAGKEEAAAKMADELENQFRQVKATGIAFREQMEARLQEVRRKRERLELEAERARAAGRERRGPDHRDRPEGRGEHFQIALRHLAEAAEHLEEAHMHDQAAAVSRARADLIRRYTDRPVERDRPREVPREGEGDRMERLLDTIERLNARMEEMEKRLDERRGR